MPFALSIDIPYETFWKLNPRKLSAYSKAYQMKQKNRDYEEWKLGIYMMNAMGVIMQKSFAKSSDAKYLERPLIEEREYQEMLENPTEEFKQQELERFFEEQRAMRVNFQSKKKRKNKIENP